MNADYQQWLEELKGRVAPSGPQDRPQLEVAPCDLCPRAARCAVEQLACTAFERFTVGRRWQIAPRIDATHERYVRIFGRT